jgi:FeS assembly SUF system regulator
MIRLTKEADYGIMLLGHIAAHPVGMLHTARELSGLSRLPLPMVSKILGSLARAEIVTGHRGVGGGYSLDQDPRTVSVARVVRAIEGPISMVQCGAEPGVCDHESGCPTRVNWSRINETVEQALEQIPIAEMLVRDNPSELIQLTTASGEARAFTEQR